MTRQELSKLEKKLIVNINLAKSKIATDGMDARIYNNALQRAKDIINDIFNDEQATIWRDEAESNRIKEILKITN